MKWQKNMSGCTIMANNKQFRIRRAIVRAVYDYSCGQDFAAVLCAPGLLLENPQTEAAFAEWRTLIDAGILIPLPGYEDRVCKLDPGIRRQMDARSGVPPVHPVLFGPEAMT